jgi:class 3 adenylate cyclase
MHPSRATEGRSPRCEYASDSTPVAEGGDLFGVTVQLAAHVCSRAAPGQILASNVVRELADVAALGVTEVTQSLTEGLAHAARSHS